MVDGAVVFDGSGALEGKAVTDITDLARLCAFATFVTKKNDWKAAPVISFEFDKFDDFFRASCDLREAITKEISVNGERELPRH